MSETGESSTSIIARSDKNMIPKVMAALNNGAVLWQPKSGFDYYVRVRDEYGDLGSISVSGVRKLEREEVIELVGVKTYALKEPPHDER